MMSTISCETRQKKQVTIRTSVLKDHALELYDELFRRGVQQI